MDKKALRRIGLECQELAKLLAPAQNVPSLAISRTPNTLTGFKSFGARVCGWLFGRTPNTEQVGQHPATPVAMQGIFIPDKLTQRQVVRLVNALLNAGNYLEASTRDGEPPK